MKMLPEELRPYEKLEKLGAGALSDAELIAVLLRTGNRDKTAVQVAVELLQNSGGLSGLRRLSISELTETDGIGRVKAILLQAAAELGTRFTRGKRVSKVRITDVNQLAELYLAEMKEYRQEIFKVLLVDRKLTVIKEVLVSVGTLDAAMVHPREVFAEAVANRAYGIVAMHNHPSGEVTPSKDDFKTTKRLILAGSVLGIELLDHLVYGDDKYYSFYREGDLDRLKNTEGL